uniref:Uncharacterized protein n=1 Tax=Arundo donax TaxID=35708 RepID=A0A0A9A9J5_ARUDO
MVSYPKPHKDNCSCFLFAVSIIVSKQMITHILFYFGTTILYRLARSTANTDSRWQCIMNMKKKDIINKDVLILYFGNNQCTIAYLP